MCSTCPGFLVGHRTTRSVWHLVERKHSLHGNNKSEQQGKCERVKRQGSWGGFFQALPWWVQDGWKQGSKVNLCPSILLSQFYGGADQVSAYWSTFVPVSYYNVKQQLWTLWSRLMLMDVKRFLMAVESNSASLISGIHFDMNCVNLTVDLWVRARKSVLMFCYGTREITIQDHFGAARICVGRISNDVILWGWN